SYFAPRGTWKRFSVKEGSVKPLVEGDAVRDWVIGPRTEAVFPYGVDLKASLEEVSVLRMLWDLRQGLRSRQELGGSHVEVGLTWYEWSRCHPERFRVTLGIGMSFVATHNHFVLDRGGKVFKQSAPVIKLPDGASVDEHLRLLGVLNSSVACFWLKQNSHNKGDSTDSKGARVTGDPALNSYEFTGTTLKDFPLPAVLPVERARLLDDLATELAGWSPAAVVAREVPTWDGLESARAQFERIRAQMIAVQEELDWEFYRLY